MNRLSSDEAVLGFSNRWYRHALRSPHRVRLASGRSIAHIDGPHFLATKLEAFGTRGGGDHLASEDLEDVVVVVEGRSTLEQELRGYVTSGLSSLLDEPHFLEALPGYFAGEPVDGARMRALLTRLRRMAAVAEGGRDS